MEKYSIKKICGEGSFGKALLCERRKDGRKCIIKEISIKKMSRKEAKQTEQEGTILARMSHPNIVSFWETFMTPQAFYIVMEFCDSGDLESFVKKRKGKLLAENQVLHLFVQISLAMKHVHDRKILHRDLKSQNIFLTSAGIVKLGDFGIARVLNNTRELAATRIGTPYYMSPEVMDNKKYNNKTDVWSLGCILYELMALKVPFDGASMRALVYNIMYSQPKPVSPVFSQDLRLVCNEMLMKDPRKRPSVNAVLSKSVVRQRISTILNPTEVKAEFSHTILHGMDILKAKAVQTPPGSSSSSSDVSGVGSSPNHLNVGAAGGVVYRPPGAGMGAGAAVRLPGQAPAPNVAAVRPSHPVAAAPVPAPSAYDAYLARQQAAQQAQQQQYQHHYPRPAPAVQQPSARGVGVSVGVGALMPPAPPPPSSVQQRQQQQQQGNNLRQIPAYNGGPSNVNANVKAAAAPSAAPSSVADKLNQPYKPTPLAVIPPFNPRPASAAGAAGADNAPAPPRPTHVDNRPAPVPTRGIHGGNPPPLSAPNAAGNNAGNHAGGNAIPPHPGHQKARAEYAHVRAGGGLQELIEKQKEQQRALQAQLARLQAQSEEVEIRKKRAAAAAVLGGVGGVPGSRKAPPAPVVSRYAPQPPQPQARVAGAGAPVSRQSPSLLQQQQRPSSAALLRAQQEKNQARKEEMERQERQQRQLMKERLEAAKRKAAENRAKGSKKSGDYDRPWANNMRKGQGLVEAERAVEKAYLGAGGGLPIPPGAAKARAAAKAQAQQAKRPEWVGVLDTDAEPGSDPEPEPALAPAPAPLAVNEANLPPPPPYFGAGAVAAAKDNKNNNKPGINTIVGGVNEQLSALQSQLEALKSPTRGQGHGRLDQPSTAAAVVMPPAPPPLAAASAVVAGSVVKGPNDMHMLRQKQREAGGVQKPTVPRTNNISNRNSPIPMPASSPPAASPAGDKSSAMEDRAERARLKREEDRAALRYMIQERRAQAHANEQLLLQQRERQQQGQERQGQARRDEGPGVSVAVSSVAAARMVEAQTQGQGRVLLESVQEGEPDAEAEVDSEADSSGDGSDTETEEEAAASDALLHATVLMTEQLREQVVAAVLAAAGVDADSDCEEAEDAEEMPPPVYDGSSAKRAASAPTNANSESATTLGDTEGTADTTTDEISAAEDDDTDINSQDGSQTPDVSSQEEEHVTTEEEAAEYECIRQNMAEALLLPERCVKTKTKTKSTLTAASIDSCSAAVGVGEETPVGEQYHDDSSSYSSSDEDEDDEEDDEFWEEESNHDDEEEDEVDSQDLHEGVDEFEAEEEEEEPSAAAPNVNVNDSLYDSPSSSSDDDELEACVGNDAQDQLLLTTAGAQLSSQISGTIVKKRLKNAQKAQQIRSQLLTKYTEDQVERTCALLRSMEEEEDDEDTPPANNNMSNDDDKDERLLSAMEAILGIEGLMDLDDFLFVTLHQG